MVESAERRLINALLGRYKKLDKVARPVTDASDTITVEFGIRLVHLDLDETEQLMKTSCWVRMVSLAAVSQQLLGENGKSYRCITPAAG